MFPPVLEPGTFRVLGGRDNHYTTKQTLNSCNGLQPTRCAISDYKHSCDLCRNALMTEEPRIGCQQQEPMLETVAQEISEMWPISAFKFEFTSLSFFYGNGINSTHVQKTALHWPGIEPGPPAWQARILPLNHQCMGHGTSRCDRKSKEPPHSGGH